MTAHGLFQSAPDAVLWGGKRYYHREASEIIDMKWYQVEGYGMGK